MSTSIRLMLALGLTPWLLAACGGGGGSSAAGAAAPAGGSAAPLVGGPVSLAYLLNSDHTLSWDRHLANGRWVPAGYASLDATASGFTLAPGGQFLYVLKASANAVVTYGLRADGGIAVLGSTPLAQPQAAVVDPAGRFLYVASPGTVSVFPIAASGLPGPAVVQSLSTGGASVQLLAFSGSGTFLYAVSRGSVQAYSVQANGSLQGAGPAIPLSGSAPSGMALDPQGRQLYVTDASAGTLTIIPLSQGEPTGAVSAPVTVPGAIGVAAATQGNAVYGVGSDGVHVYVAGAGTLSPLGSTLALPAGSKPTAVALNQGGSELDIVSAGSNLFSRFAIGPQGALTALAPLRTRNAPVALLLSTRSVTATPALVFASNNVDDTVTAFTVHQGTLVPQGSVVTGLAPSALVPDVSHRLLYVADAGNAAATPGDLRAYRWDATSGSLSVASPPTMTVPNPAALAIEPSDRFLYAVDLDTGSLYPFATSDNGTLTAMSPVSVGATGPRSVVADPTGQFLYVADKDSAEVSVFRIDPISGVPTLTGTAPVGATDPYGLSFDASGNFLYVTALGPKAAAGAQAGNGTVTAFRIDPVSGALSPAGTAATGPTPTSAAAAGNSLFVVDSGSNQISPYLVDPMTGVLTAGNAFGVTAYPYQLAVDASQTLAVLTGNSNGLVVPYAIAPGGQMNALPAASTGSAAYAVTIVDQMQ